jgi:hypothetical protein
MSLAWSEVIMAWMNITCRCGHTNDYTAFCSTDMFGDLPYGQYQCPGCGVAWQRKESGHRIISSGSAATIVPGKVELQIIDSRF